MYGKSVVQGFLQVSNYRSELFVDVLAKLVTFFFVILFWLMVSKSSTVNFVEIASYLLLVNGLREFVDGQLRLFKEIASGIKDGSISNLLLKPIDPILFYFSRMLGTRVVHFSYSVLFLVAGFYISTNKNFSTIGWSMLALMIGVVISIGLNTIVGSMAWWTTEADGIRNTFVHFGRVFGGLWVPLNFFPGIWRGTVINGPYATQGYLPVAIFQQGLTEENKWALASSLVWMVLITIFSRWFWQKGVKRYEAVGI